ncbi:MAG TPA: hypothetical protein VHQ87_04680, partial [Rhizobacter sp.]|nr:hypothetical protein [Rhizobacter sp.]
RRNKPWRLILNGDIVDFISITRTPDGPAPFPVSAEERQLGLLPEEPKCVWKLQQTAERHPEVFDALARFLHKGNSVHIIRGNHDTEWRFPAVQAEFRRLMGAGAKRVVFHDWFYLEPGYFYAEHGNAHDAYSMQPDFFGNGVQLPLSSKVLRYFVNRYTEQVELPGDVDAWGVREYIDWVLKAGNPLRVAADYFVMVARVIYPVVRQSLRLTRAMARAAAPGLTDRVVSEQQARQLLAVASRPAEQSLFDSMQLFYLDRMVLALFGLVSAFWCAGAVHGFWARAGALSAVGIVFAALNALLGAQRRTDAHPMLQKAARRVAQIFGVRYVAMGHSHRAVEEALGNGSRYFNTGSWMDGGTHLVVADGEAHLRKWGAAPEPLAAAEGTAPVAVPA